MARILLIDDDVNIRRSLKNALDRRDHQVVTAENIKEAKSFLTVPFDVVILDIMLPDGNGLNLLKEIRTENPSQIVIMISGQADIDMAIEAIKSGAYDFIEKPFSLEKVLITIQNAVRTTGLIDETKRLNSILYGDFIGQSPVVEKLKNDITKSAPRTSRFLILGENGTGKELIAHMVHNHSIFEKGPFVAVNCAALPSELVEAELFGHTTGAFTGAGKARKGKFIEADRGTIFLDEISEMPLEAQAKILRVVETKTVTPVGSDKPVTIDCNIIAASNRDLYAMATEGKFRQDLLYRLNVVQFIIPPLRERLDDLPLLCEYFFKNFALENKNPVKSLSKDALEYLSAFYFPGNIRELKNLLERLNIYCDQQNIERSDVEEMLPFVPKQKPTTLKDAVVEFERQQIKMSIDKNGGNISKAAKELGLERSHLYKKIKRLNDK